MPEPKTGEGDDSLGEERQKDIKYHRDRIKQLEKGNNRDSEELINEHTKRVMEIFYNK